MMGQATAEILFMFLLVLVILGFTSLVDFLYPRLHSWIKDE